MQYLQALSVLTCHHAVAFLQIFPPGAEIVADIAPRSPHQVVLNTTTLRLVWRDQHVGRDEERSVLAKGFICEKTWFQKA